VIVIKEKKSVSRKEDVLKSPTNQLILYNDDSHTFDFVIESLIEVCGHDPVTAEQCTMIVHYKGKCDVKSGSQEILLPLRNELGNRGLIATIE
jgi:ATP-dependent Clp protease adaptor protein ClpS